jgi:hypothetical protein
MVARKRYAVCFVDDDPDDLRRFKKHLARLISSALEIIFREHCKISARLMRGSQIYLCSICIFLTE